MCEITRTDGRMAGASTPQDIVTVVFGQASEIRQQSHTSRGRWWPFGRANVSWTNALLLAALAVFVVPGRAAYMQFSNCLSDSILNSDPHILQFTPLNVSAFFNTTAPSHNLNITAYGNISGLLTLQDYPSPDDPQWQNPNDTLGKIVDLDTANNKFTTLFTTLNVLSYTPYEGASRFCNSTIHGECPLAPAFYVNHSDLAQLPAFSISHDLYSTYAFTSITATLLIKAGDVNAQHLGCIQATITPRLGDGLSDILEYLPLVVLIIVGIATICAAVFSPWGSHDTFHWTSNFGRDEDVLRLVTPGFGDCLQYIQFIVLTGSLSLNYPGYYQPVVSNVAWSSLMFNESLVTGGHGTQTVVDGLYQMRTNSTYGLDRMSQYVGMTSPKDMWADMMVWLVVLVVAIAVLTQIGFAARWLYRQVANVPAEDLRSKNWQFTAGNVVRTVFNYFLLPLVSLSMFQLVIAGHGPTYAVALAAIVLVAIVLFAVKLLLLFSKTRPRSFLFDDMPTVLTYGPLYNTYCDDAATFALIPILLGFVRGIAIGAVQQSGVAQLVLLAICEIILILTLNAFKPFPSATSMNIYHTAFSCVRLVTILLAIAFVPSLGVTDNSRSWIGYAILLIHAAVLVFGFFLNGIQTLIEVFARMAGAGGGEHNAARGGLTKVFGMRQLSRRMPRADPATRSSMASNAAMLMNENEPKTARIENTRSRSISASSTMLLNRGSEGRQSQLFAGTNPYVDGQTSPDGVSTFSRQPSNHRMSVSPSPGGIIGIQQVDTKDPYYRPPRRNTMDPLAPSDKGPPASFASVDRRLTQSEQEIQDAGEGRSTPAARETDSNAIEDDEEGGENELTKTKTDYAVREVDFYYGVRGPALSSGTRKLKTGPADPTGPVSSATGWFKGLLGGKTKEKGKGFEVVRSSRAPPPGLISETPETGRGTPDPYRDDPEAMRRYTGQESELEGSGPHFDSDQTVKALRLPPSLPLIDTGGGIEMPSRVGSQTSQVSKRPGGMPNLPRRSSRRASSRDTAADAASFSELRSHADPRLTTVVDTSPVKTRKDHTLAQSGSAGRIPFTGNTNFQGHAPRTSRYSTGGESSISTDENDEARSYVPHARHSSSALGAHAPDLNFDRPSSVGFVQQHRASDHIRYNPNSPEFVGSSAEFLGHERVIKRSDSPEFPGTSLGQERAIKRFPSR